MGGKGAIVLVTRNFPPLVGGMENVNQRLVRELCEVWRVGLCGPKGSREHAPEASVVSETRISPLPYFLVAILLRAIGMSLRLRPQIVIAGSGLTLPIAWVAARLSGARLGAYLHGLDIIAQNPVYQVLWPRFIKACDVILVNSRSTAALAMGRGARRDRVHILHPGTLIPTLDPTARSRFRSSIGFSTEPMLLSIGRLTRRKGLAEFVGQAMPLILKVHPTVRLVIIGGEATHALTATGESEQERILSAARAVGAAHAVEFVGRLSDLELGEAYQAADLHVFPVLQLAGDIEGFGMVALESAAHGLETVAFDVGGIPDSVEDAVTGALVASGDYARFAEEVVNRLRAGARSRDECREFAKGKTWEKFGQRLRKIVGAEIRG